MTVVMNCGGCSRHRSHSVELDLADLTHGLTLSNHGRSHLEAAIDLSSLSSLFAFHSASLWLWVFLFIYFYL